MRCGSLPCAHTRDSRFHHTDQGSSATGQGLPHTLYNMHNNTLLSLCNLYIDRTLTIVYNVDIQSKRKGDKTRTTITISKAWYEDVCEAITMVDPYFYTENGVEMVEVDVDESEFNRISEDLGWI